MNTHNIQYTIRSIPAAVDRNLREKARRSHKSLNAISLEALFKEAGLEGKATVHHDLDLFFGSWVEDSAIDKALMDQRHIDKKLWK